MKKFSQKKGILIFYLFDFILLLIFIAAFLPFGKKKDSPPKRDTALLNPDNKSLIKVICVSQGKNKVKLYKKGNIWLGKNWNFDEGAAGDFIWPADVQNISNVIESCSRIQSVFLLSNKNSSWESYDLKKEDAIELAFYSDENESSPLSILYFGRRNSLNSRIAFRTWRDSSVYECDASLSYYLNPLAQFWVDPFVFPQCLTEYSRATSELVLRHGSLVNLSPASHVKADFILFKDFENGSSASFSVYKKDENYVVIPVFKAGPAFGEDDNLALNSIDYRYSLSDITFNKFKEELK